MAKTAFKSDFGFLQTNVVCTMKNTCENLSQICKKLNKRGVKFRHIKHQYIQLVYSPVKNLVRSVSSGYSEGFALCKGVMQATELHYSISFQFGLFKVFLYQECSHLSIKLTKPGMYCYNVYTAKKPQAETLQPLHPTLPALL